MKGNHAQFVVIILICLVLTASPHVLSSERPVVQIFDVSRDVFLSCWSSTLSVADIVGGLSYLQIKY